VSDEGRPKAAVAVLVALPAEKILMLKRAPGTWQEGTWCFPGGRVQLGETIQEACQRELKEETGLDIPTGEMPDNPEFIESPSGYDLAVFQAGLRVFGDEADPAFQEALDITLSEEHTEYGWFTIEEAFALELAGPATKQILEELEVPGMMDAEAAGDFPSEGEDAFAELALQMAADPDNGIVRVEFDKSVSWFGLSADGAESMAKLLIDKAAELRAKTTVH